MIPNHFDPHRRARFTAAALLTITFLAGALTGAAILPHFAEADNTGMTADLLAPPCAAVPGPPPPFAAAERFSAIVGARLGLSADQERQIDAILAKHRSAMELFLREMRPGLQQRLNDVRDDIRAVLTPAQRIEMDRIEAERRDLMMRRLPPPPARSIPARPPAGEIRS